MASLGDFNTAPQSSIRLGQTNTNSTRQISPETLKLLNEIKAEGYNTSKSSSDIAGRAKDVGIDALKGAVSLAQVPLGLGDMAGFGATKAAERVGIQTNKTQDILSSQYSEGRKKSEQEIANTKGALNRATSYLTHPASLVGGIEQSLPLMLPGVGAASKLGALGKAAQIAAGAVGEGVVTTGLQANEAESKGVSHDKYALPALEAGIGTAAISGLTGGLLGDAATNVLRGIQGNKGVEVVKSLFSEGLQESAQSGQEKIQENRIYDRPLMEGVPEEMGSGAVMGAVMGGGMTAISRNEQVSDSSIPITLHNPETDKPVTNPEINKAFSDFNTNFQGNHTTSETYSKTYQEAHSKLDTVINNPESSFSDVADARFAKRYMDQGHGSKVKTEQDDIVRDSEINAANPSKEDKFKDINSMTPEELGKTHEILYKVVSGLDASSLDETGQNLTQRFQEVDLALKTIKGAGVDIPVTPAPSAEPDQSFATPNDYTAQSTTPLFPTEEIDINNYSQNTSTANENSNTLDNTTAESTIDTKVDDLQSTEVKEAPAIPESELATKSTQELKDISKVPENKANLATSEGVVKQLTSKLVDDTTSIVTAKSKGITDILTYHKVNKILNDVKTLPFTPLTKDAIKTTQTQLPMIEASKDDPSVSTAHQAVIDDISQTSTIESVASSIEQALPEEVTVPKGLDNNYSRLSDSQLAGEGRAVLEAIKLKESIDKDVTHPSYQVTESDTGKETILYFKNRLPELSKLSLEELNQLKDSLTSVKSKRSLEARRKSAGKGDYDLSDNPSSTIGESFNELKKQLDLLKKGMGVNFLAKHGIQFHLMEDATTYKFPDYYNIDKTVLPRLRGFIIPNPNGGTDIFLNAKLVNTKMDLVGTVAHEIVGHFGMANLFEGKDKYYTMLKGMLNNPRLRTDILSLNRRWSAYLDHWLAKNSILDLPEDKIYDFNGTLIPEEVAIKLADEYMAELAKAKILDSKFIEQTVGYGVRNSKARSAKRNFRDGILKEYLTKLKYFLREVFGKHFDKASEQEMLVLVSSVIDTTFENLSPDMLAHSNKAATTTFSTKLNSPKLDGDTLQFSNQLEAMYDLATTADPEKVIEVNTKILGDTTKFFQAMTSGFGSQSSTILSRTYDKLKAAAIKNPVIAATTTFGNMPYSDVIQAINTVAKGNMAVVEKHAPAIARVMATLNNVDNQVVFEYFTTPNADSSLLQNFTPLQRNSIIAAKESINKLSKGLIDLNPSLSTAFAKYEDCYLHTTYFKYLNQYKGSNKTPFGAWMKKKKIHTTQEQMMLGMIRDVRFLVPETLGIISRDHTLLSLFDTISKVSSENNTHWVLNSNKLITSNGMSLNYDEAIDKIKELKGYINTPEMNEALFSGLKLEQINEFKDRVSKLEEFVRSIDNEFTKSLSDAFDKSRVDGTTKATTTDEFLQQHYTRMSDNPRNGALRNKTVRNEIFKDLEAFNKAYDLKSKDNVEKFFADGGTAERVTALWKLGMIGLNPASIVRNVMGSFSLLDLGTPTNSIKLTNKLVNELKSAINNKHTDNWKLAESYGLFGVTFSAVELQVLHNEYSKPLEDAYERWKKHGDSPIESQMSFLNPVLQKIAEVADKSKIGATKMFAFTEGLFKTVAFSDYVERWESQNKDQYPDGAKSLDLELQKVLYSKAALHANDTLIDYSSVPGFIRTLRKLPLGSPFITFTYKALPITLKAAITNPIKFAKYAALPSLITMLAMSLNDWDDDDVDEARRKLPEFYRQSSGVAPLPFKDDMGRIQWINLDPIFPWTQWSAAGRKLYEDYMIGGVAELPSSTLEALHREGGFLGGPMPQVIAAMTTGINTFTGKPIETAGASSTQHLQEDLEYMWNLSTPAFLHSAGWMANMYHTLVGEPTKDRFGDVKNTTGQSLSEITGFKAIPSTDGGEVGLVSKYKAKIQDIKSFQHKVAADPNMNVPDKASKLASSNDRLKVILKNMQQEFGK